MKHRVQRNDYPGYPGRLSAEAKDLMLSKLNEICDASPPDARKLMTLWRVLVEGKEPSVKLPKPRFRSTRG
jgi:hypothetical protein